MRRREYVATLSVLSTAGCSSILGVGGGTGADRSDRRIHIERVSVANITGTRTSGVIGVSDERASLYQAEFDLEPNRGEEYTTDIEADSEILVAISTDSMIRSDRYTDSYIVGIDVIIDGDGFIITTENELTETT